MKAAGTTSHDATMKQKTLSQKVERMVEDDSDNDWMAIES